MRITDAGVRGTIALVIAVPFALLSAMSSFMNISINFDTAIITWVLGYYFGRGSKSDRETTSPDVRRRDRGA